MRFGPDAGPLLQRTERAHARTPPGRLEKGSEIRFSEDLWIEPIPSTWNVVAIRLRFQLQTTRAPVPHVFGRPRFPQGMTVALRKETDKQNRPEPDAGILRWPCFWFRALGARQPIATTECYSSFSSLQRAPNQVSTMQLVAPYSLGSKSSASSSLTHPSSSL